MAEWEYSKRGKNWSISRKESSGSNSCEYCGGDFHMVMVKDEIWENVCDEWSDCICDKCIEKRMGRKIELNDLKESDDLKIIPCNGLWAIERNRGDILRAIYTNDELLAYDSTKKFVQ